MKAASNSPRAAPKAHANATSMGRVFMVSGSDGGGFKGETGLQMLRVSVEPVACPIGRHATGLQHGGLNGTDEGLGVDDVLMPATEDDVLTHGV